MTAAWPNDLPQFVLRDGFQLQEGETRLRMETDSGPAMLRNVASSAADLVSMPIICTATQLASFRTFYRTTLQRGTLPFTKVNPIDSGETWTLQFGSRTPIYRHLGGDNYSVSMELEVMP